MNKRQGLLAALKLTFLTKIHSHVFAQPILHMLMLQENALAAQLPHTGMLIKLLAYHALQIRFTTRKKLHVYAQLDYLMLMLLELVFLASALHFGILIH